MNNISIIGNYSFRFVILRKGMIKTMKVSWIKEEKDNKNFAIAEKLGMDVHRLNNPEDVDKTMESLVKQNCNMIVLSNEIAGFSEDIIKKYQNNKEVNIIISPRK